MKKSKKPSLSTVKFNGKKVVTKKEFKKYKLIETWELTDFVNSSEYLVHDGNKYQLVSSVEKEITTPSE